MAGWSDLSSWATILSAGLNGLAGGSRADSGTITPPTGPRPFYFLLRINLASFNPATGQALLVYLRPAADNTPTNFADPTPDRLIANLPYTSGASAKYLWVDRTQCPTAPFVISVVNGVSGNTALAASGSTVELQTQSEA